eukprot:TRINITY_DN15415_c0_g1_i1.p1 TRINITY_DN15415_c0_g1~~TRINITY_DN15415_c0_g1_i1.p1  ORF type:complete len:1116 (-),score=166.60 TRINITY_DN15415_c0_g1_i1:22-3042(-)
MAISNLTRYMDLLSVYCFKEQEGDGRSSFVEYLELLMKVLSYRGGTKRMHLHTLRCRLGEELKNRNYPLLISVPMKKLFILVSSIEHEIYSEELIEMIQYSSIKSIFGFYEHFGVIEEDAGVISEICLMVLSIKSIPTDWMPVLLQLQNTINSESSALYSLLSNTIHYCQAAPVRLTPSKPHDDKCLILLLKPPTQSKRISFDTSILYAEDQFIFNLFPLFYCKYQQQKEYLERKLFQNVLDCFLCSTARTLLLDVVRSARHARLLLHISNQRSIQKKAIFLSPAKQQRTSPSHTTDNFFEILSIFAKHNVLHYVHLSANIIDMKALQATEEGRVHYFPNFVSMDHLLSQSKLLKISEELAQRLNIRMEYLYPTRSDLMLTQHNSHFVFFPDRYLMCFDYGGSRCFLYQCPGGITYLFYSPHHIIRTTLSSLLPPNTVLDGEIVSVDCNFYFLISDVLCFDSQNVWHLDFNERLSYMNQLSFPHFSPQNFEETSNFTSNNSPIVSIRLFLKSYFPLSSPFPIYNYRPFFGLIFTATFSPYHPKYSPYIHLWYPAKNCTLRVQELSSRSFFYVYNKLNEEKWKVQFESGLQATQIPLIQNTLVECTFNEQQRLWKFSRVRYDRTSEDPPRTIKKLLTKEYLLFEDLKSSFGMPYHNCFSDIQFYHEPLNQHPGSQFSESLLHQIEMRVQMGVVEKTIDGETGLAIYNYRDLEDLDEISRMCRGLIINLVDLKPAALPFLKFPEDLDASKDLMNPEAIVQGTEKIDGTLIIAFIWNGSLRTSTRRRMNSQQAIWAKQFIIKRLRHEQLQEGYTYLFEAVYQLNQVIVEYPFDDLILLSVISLQGNELNFFEISKIAKNLGCRVPTRLIGKLKDFTNFAKKRRNYAMEGWVINFPSGEKLKIVNDWWIEAATLIFDINPLSIWHKMWLGSIERFLSSIPFPAHSSEAWKMFNLLQEAYRQAESKDKRSIFELIKPTQNLLPGYIPSLHYQQTFAKGFSTVDSSLYKIDS